MVTDWVTALRRIDIKRIYVSILKGNEREIVTYNKRQHLDQHVDADGVPLSPSYSFGYRRYKRNRGRSGEVDLDDTGKYHDSFSIKIESDFFTVEAFRRDGAKDVVKELKEKYGKVQGLTEESIDEIISKIIIPEFDKAINQALT